MRRALTSDPRPRPKRQAGGTSNAKPHHLNQLKAIPMEPSPANPAASLAEALNKFPEGGNFSVSKLTNGAGTLLTLSSWDNGSLSLEISPEGAAKVIAQQSKKPRDGKAELEDESAMGMCD